MSSSQYRLRECEFSTCTDHTEYICETCPHVRFCAQCKESHVNDLKNIDHKIVTYRDKYEFTSCEPPVRFIVQNMTTTSNYIYKMHMKPSNNNVKTD